MANLRRKYQGDYYKIPKTAIEELFANFPGIAKHSNPTEKEKNSNKIQPRRGRSYGNLRRKYKEDYYKIPKTVIEEGFANFPGIAKHSNPTEKEKNSYQIHPQRGRGKRNGLS